MSGLLEDFRDFLEESPTAWHATYELSNRLASINALSLEDDAPWSLTKGKRYFVQRGGSLCGFTLPLEKPSAMTILGAHTDSPALKLKPSPEIFSDTIHFLETEIYGSPLLSSWFNRDLAIAGRLIVENVDGKQEEKLVFLDQTPLFIPQLSLHLDRDVNSKGVFIDPQDHLRPIFALMDGKREILKFLLQQYLPFKEMLAFDLFLVPLEKTRLVGIAGEMLAAYRLDNLASAYACVTALALAKPSPCLQMTVLFDGEEIGSSIPEGAASPFFEDVVQRIGAFYGISLEEMICMKRKSLFVSVDVAHAYNPNFSNKYDPQHRVIPGQGIAIKYSPDKNYSTDGKTAARVVALCKKLDLKYQSFSSRSDIRSGRTIGPIFSSRFGIPTVDIGIPIFSMHSIREVLAVQDQADMCQLLTSLLE
jgi:aspartyl aminopeptidase